MLNLALKYLVKCLFVLLLCLTFLPAQAQISYESKGVHKQLRKKFLKQANYVDAEYKDSHLDMSTYNFKKGESGRFAETKNRKRVQNKRNANIKKGFLFWKKESEQEKKKDNN